MMTAAEFRSIREHIGLLRRELALALRVSVQAVQNWDSGRQKPPGPVEVVMSAAYEIPAVAARLRKLARAPE
jgi:DNA-binding transcriptional regulator YiaG